MRTINVLIGAITIGYIIGVMVGCVVVGAILLREKNK